MISSLMVMAFVSPSPIPSDLLREQGFDSTLFEDHSPVRRSSKSNLGRFRNGLGEAVTVEIGWASEQDHTLGHRGGYNSREHRESFANRYAVAPSYRQMPSRLPPKLGYTWHNASSITIAAASPQSGVVVTYEAHIRTTGRGFADPEPFDLQTKSALVERIARHTLANAAGLRLDDAGVGALAGRSIKKAKCRRSNRVFGRVDEWTEGEGWSFAEDKFYGIINLKKGSKWAVLPLGADQIKVNGVWKEMGDSAAFYDGKLYLPEAGLKHLKDAD